MEKQEFLMKRMIEKGIGVWAEFLHDGRMISREDPLLENETRNETHLCEFSGNDLVIYPNVTIFYKENPREKYGKEAIVSIPLADISNMSFNLNLEVNHWLGPFSYYVDIELVLKNGDNYKLKSKSFLLVRIFYDLQPAYGFDIEDPRNLVNLDTTLNTMQFRKTCKAVFEGLVL